MCNHERVAEYSTGERSAVRGEADDTYRSGLICLDCGYKVIDADKDGGQCDLCGGSVLVERWSYDTYFIKCLTCGAQWLADVKTSAEAVDHAPTCKPAS